MRRLHSFFSGWRQEREAIDAFPPLPRSTPPVCVVGDLHGRSDLLERMLDAIERRLDAGAHRVIFAGDMIDRGPDSAGVLRRLSALTRVRPRQIICLMGNHERMLLDFLEDPLRNGPRWLASGGNKTLASYGISPWTRGNEATTETWLQTRATALASALPGGSADWLASLPLIWSEGALSVIHAGADPACAMADQTAQTLLWGHPAFLRKPRRDGIWVAHGHTITHRAQARNGRIAVDTGAWRTDRLSAAWIGADGIDFIEVTSR